MSLKDCLKKLKLDQYEADIIKSDAQDLTLEGLKGKEAAIQAINDRIEEYNNERQSILTQLEEQGASISGIQVEEIIDDTEIQAILEKYKAEPAAVEPSEVDFRTISGRQVREGFTSETFASDDVGQPITLHRGAPVALHPDHFAKEALGKASGKAPSALGVWMTTDAEHAAGYGVVEQFHLDIRNPKQYTVETFPEYNTLDEYYNHREDLRAQGHDGIELDFRDVGGGLQYIAFDPDQVIAKPKEYFQEVDIESENFRKWAGGADVRVLEGYEINDFNFSGEGPFVLKVHHGTTHEFNIFEAERGNKEGQFGAVNYFTSDEGDAWNNYAGTGPDLTQRIEQRKEQLDWELDENPDQYGYTSEQIEEQGKDVVAREIAEKELHGGTEQVLELFVKTEKPFVIGDNQWIEFFDNEELQNDAIDIVADDNNLSAEEIKENIDEYEDQISERRWELESEQEHPLAQAIQQVARRNNIDAPELAASVYELGSEATPEQIENLIRESEEVAYAEGDDGLIGFHIIGEVIEELGYDSIILKNAGERFENMDMGSETVHVHVFESGKTNIKSTSNIGAFDPRDPDIYKQQKRGSIQFGDEQTIINLFKSKDNSTFLHESGHLFLDVMQDIASRSDAVPELRAEWTKIEEFLGVEPGADLTTEQHEKWATSFEAYLREGKAPSPELRGAFQTFRRWLLQVYRTVNKLLGKDALTDDIRGIFDRMLATDSQLESARTDGYEAIFESSESMGITDKEFAEYKAVEKEVTDKAQEQMDVEAIKEAQREKSEQWAKDKERVQTQVELEINQRQDLRAKHFLVNGTFLPGDPLSEVIKEPVKLSLPDLKEMYEGTDLEYQIRKLPPMAKRKEGGLHPDIVAEMLGYKSGDSLVKALLESGNRKDIINQETEARMAAEYGDMRADMDRTAQMAIDALHSDKRAHFLMLELRALNKRTGTGQTQASVLKQAAYRLIDESKVPEAARSEHFLADERKAGRAAQKAVAEGDLDAARDAKRQQILSHYLYMQARDAKAEQAKFLRYFKKFNKKGTRKALKGEHLDQIDQLMEKYDFRKIPLKTVEDRQSLRLWVDAQKAEGLIPNISDAILDDVTRTNYKELTMSEFRGFYDAVKSIEAIARNENLIKSGNEFIEYETAIQELSESAYAENKAGPPPPLDPGVIGPLGTAKNWIHGMDATLLKTEQMIAWLDGDKPDGPWRKFLFKPIADAEHARNDLDVTYTAKLIEAMEKLPKDHANRLHQTVYVESLGMDITRAGLIHMALHTGTESNFFKLVDGSQQLPTGGWSEAQVTDALNQNLSQEDWEFVDSIWRILDDQGEGSLFDMLNKVEKEITGTPIKKVKSRKVQTPYGELEGGYVPIVYDPRFSRAGMQKADEIGESGGRPSTKSGSVNERIETYSAPLKLDLFTIPQHISEVTQDVTHRRAVRDTWKILSDQRVRRVLQETLGEKYEPQFRKWVAHVASDKMVDQTGVDNWMRLIRAARLNTSIVAMGFKWTTVVQQPLGITQSIDVMRGMKGGKSYLTKEVGNFAKNPIAMKEIVFEKSGEIRHRMSNLDRDLRDNLRKRLGRKDATAEMVRYAFMGIGLSDMAVSLPTWMASYKWAKDNQYTESQSVEWADSRVRISQGSGSAKDLSAVQRGHEAMKLLTVFYSYFNAYYQRIRDTGRMTKSVKDVPDLMLRHWYITIIPAIFSELMSGRGPDEDEEFEDWATRKVIAYPFQTIPFVRDVASAVESGYGYDWTPAGGVGEHTVRLFNKADDFIEGDADFSDVLGQAVKTSGYFLGLPTGQATITFNHIMDAAEGDTDFNPYYLLVREPEK